MATPQEPARRPDARRTQAERRAESEQRLLTASVELIVEQGLARTSLADIGRRAGASHALVNHRFGSKDELVDRIIEEATRYYAHAARTRIGARTGLDAVLELCALYLDLVDGPDPIGRVHVVLWSEAVAHSASRRNAQLEWDRQFRDFVSGLIEDGVAEGSIRADVPVADTALTIVGALRGTAMQLLVDGGIDLDSAQSLIRELVLSDLRVRPDAG
ncbi:TetR/AcrR family transcriptional regulator [Nocardioides marmoriginsengisoli]|uniref:TetR/AcrR family transcriptional regulator n=1 Tax=Nocardioides marmoriginsengisoli TaxID=661483 RepID=A0A3N0CPT7_9ACTN|nr:TetR/AcrR family transcriptional regulator [Nocardioides marmoriginsengisoli]RNL65321.1 TetR/AcrR family transcriptional regulator [Nocardioides marmoriginsengisoli]